MNYNSMLLTDGFTIQSYLNKNVTSLKPLAVDGQAGPNTLRRAVVFLTQQQKNGSLSQSFNFAKWNPQRILTAVEQTLLDNFNPLGPIDGISGPRTMFSLEKYQNIIRDMPTPPHLSPTPITKSSYTNFVPPVYPRQKDVISYFGKPGDTSNLTFVNTPYPLYLDWNLDQKVSRMRVHKKVAESVDAALSALLAHYGLEGLHDLDLDQFGGSYNFRKMRGGNSYSMHSWGIAIDWDADKNSLRSNAKTASFSTDLRKHAFLDIWEAVGFTSLGRVRNYDWMHVQAARL